jgi:hypothetical protein
MARRPLENVKLGKAGVIGAVASFLGGWDIVTLGTHTAADVARQEIALRAAEDVQDKIDQNGTHEQ